MKENKENTEKTEFSCVKENKDKAPGSEMDQKSTIAKRSCVPRMKKKWKEKR